MDLLKCIVYLSPGFYQQINTSRPLRVQLITCLSSTHLSPPPPQPHQLLIIMITRDDPTRLRTTELGIFLPSSSRELAGHPLSNPQSLIISSISCSWLWRTVCGPTDDVHPIHTMSKVSPNR